MMSLLPSMDQGRCGASMWCEHVVRAQATTVAGKTHDARRARAHTHEIPARHELTTERGPAKPGACRSCASGCPKASG